MELRSELPSRASLRNSILRALHHGVPSLLWEPEATAIWKMTERDVASNQWQVFAKAHDLNNGFIAQHWLALPVPVAAQSKASIYSRSPAAIVGSNPTRGMDVCCVCVVR
jgi:hypothetical protein